MLIRHMACAAPKSFVHDAMRTWGMCLKTVPSLPACVIASTRHHWILLKNRTRVKAPLRLFRGARKRHDARSELITQTCLELQAIVAEQIDIALVVGVGNVRGEVGKPVRPP